MASHSSGGFICCVPGCFSNNKRDVNLSFCGFPKEKKLRSRWWLHKISVKNFSPSTGHWVCSLTGHRTPDTGYVAFRRRQKNLHEQCSCYFSFGRAHLRPSPKPRRKLVLGGPSTSSQEASPTAISAASSTKETDKSEGGGTQQQIE